jgi:hypothetical protein
MSRVQDLNQQICRFLGIEPNEVCAVDLKLRPAELPELTLVRNVYEVPGKLKVENDEIVTETVRFRLVPIEEEVPVDEEVRAG